MSILSHLATIVEPARILTKKEDLAYAMLDKSSNVAPSLPLAVVKVISRDELINVVQACIKARQSLVMRGAGSGKSGGAVASEKSIIIDSTALNRMIAIDKENLTADVEPGLILGDFQRAVRQEGLFYPPDPASFKYCTIGGNVAENAGGPSTLKYGCTREYLLGGEAILGTGEVINFGKRCPKGVAGLDIASLLCGSEGILAVFTRFTLRLLPLPKENSTGLFVFADEEKALLAVNQLLGQGHLPKTLEYIDSTCMQALQKLGFFMMVPQAAALLIECDASYPSGAKEQLLVIKKQLESQLLSSFIAEDEEERHEYWRARSSLSEACTKFLGHKLSEDMAIPLKSMHEFRQWFEKKAQSLQLCPALFGHAGDGNLHVQILFTDEQQRPIAESLRHEVLLKVLALGGTLSAEHGIGLQKKSYLPLEQSDSLLALQKRIKKAFDPHNLLNPGKIFDLDS